MSGLGGIEIKLPPSLKQTHPYFFFLFQKEPRIVVNKFAKADFLQEHHPDSLFFFYPNRFVFGMLSL